MEDALGYCPKFGGHDLILKVKSGSREDTLREGDITREDTVGERDTTGGDIRFLFRESTCSSLIMHFLYARATFTFWSLIISWLIKKLHHDRVRALSSRNGIVIYGVLLNAHVTHLYIWYVSLKKNWEKSFNLSLILGWNTYSSGYLNIEMNIRIFGSANEYSKLQNSLTPLIRNMSQ